MKRILVVCSSRTGHTRKLAEAIARACDGDLELIKDRVDRLGLGGYLRSAAQALLHVRPWIQPARHPPGDYALVIVGTPVWAWNMAGPVRSYLHRYADRCRRVAFFCTYGGVGADKVLADMQRLCGRRALATLALRQAVVAQGQGALQAAVQRFAGQFNGRRHEAPGSGPRRAA